MCCLLGTNSGKPVRKKFLTQKFYMFNKKLNGDIPKHLLISEGSPTSCTVISPEGLEPRTLFLDPDAIPPGEEKFQSFGGGEFTVKGVKDGVQCDILP